MKDDYYSIGNLQVLGAKRAEVAALLPTAKVTRECSENYVTVVDDSFEMKVVAAVAKKLSGQLPQAVVVSAAMDGEEWLELAVWQKGKQLTVRSLSPVKGGSRKGDPHAFCQALGLPEEDEARLEIIWDKGYAREQLEFTEILMGAPLCCSALNPPYKRISRDEEWVDDWMRYLTEPARVKNQTRIQVIQELPGLQFDERTEGNGQNGFFHLCPVGSGEDYDWTESFFCRPGADGKLERLPQLDPRQEVVRVPHAECKYIPVGKERVLALQKEGERAYSIVVEDSAGLLVCPLALELNGSRRSCLNAWSMKDGGILALLDGQGRDGELDCLVRYAVDGTTLWVRELGRPCKFELFAEGRVCPDGLLWLSDEEGFFSIGMQGEDVLRLPFSKEFHDDEDRECLVRYTMLGQNVYGNACFIEDAIYRDKNCVESRIISTYGSEESFDSSEPLPVKVVSSMCKMLSMGMQMLIYQWKRGAWMLSESFLSIKAGMTDHRFYLDAVQDGAERVWFRIGGAWEAYDMDLTLLSRHKLRGSVWHHYLDQKGRLCVVTYDYEEHVFRVYRLA